MRKKLYKAKKNWVIGLAAGTLLLVGGATTDSADTNWNSSADQFSQFGYNSRPTVTWSGIDTSQYPGGTANDPANIDSAVLDANVNVQTTGEDTGLNQTTPGFSYNMTTNGHSLRNDESVNVDYTSAMALIMERTGLSLTRPTAARLAMLAPSGTASKRIT